MKGGFTFRVWRGMKRIPHDSFFFHLGIASFCEA